LRSRQCFENRQCGGFVIIRLLVTKQMSAKHEKIFFVIIYNENGFTERDYFQVRDIVNASEPDYWNLIQPCTVDAYFLVSNRGKERCENLVSKVNDLKKNSTAHQYLGIATSFEECIVNKSIFGKLKSCPILMGNRMDVCKSAVENSKSTMEG